MGILPTRFREWSDSSDHGSSTKSRKSPHGSSDLSYRAYNRSDTDKKPSMFSRTWARINPANIRIPTISNRIPAFKERLRVFRRKLPAVGRAGGHWYIRLPLWAQTTILILLIVLISTVLLFLISAVQMWHFATKLVKARLGAGAGMVALSLEQQFNLVGQDLTSIASRPTMVDFFDKANANSLNSGVWKSMVNDLALPMSTFHMMLGLHFYNKNHEKIYSYTSRQTDSTRRGPISFLLPRNFYPLSDDAQRNNTLAMLYNGYPWVMGRNTVSSTNDTNLFLTYTVTLPVSRDELFSTGDVDPLGFLTVLLQTPITISSVQPWTPSTYDHGVQLTVVRASDVIRGNGSRFSYLIGYPEIRGGFSQQFNVSQFPILNQALNLAKEPVNAQTSASPVASDDDPSMSLGLKIYRNSKIVAASTPLANRTFTMGTAAPLASEIDIPPRTTLAAGPPEKGNEFFSLRGFNRTQVRASGTLTANSSSTSVNPYAGAVPDYRPASGVNGKRTGGNLHAISPQYEHQASVGYSFANILADQWLVFVELPEKNALSSTKHARMKIIDVGCGIVVFVLVSILPLSVWQTRGFYSVYQNMKLRPIFILEDGPDGPEGPVGPEGGEGAEGAEGAEGGAEGGEERKEGGAEGAEGEGEPTQEKPKALLGTPTREVSGSTQTTEKSVRKASSRTTRTADAVPADSGPSPTRSTFLDLEQGFYHPITPRNSASGSSGSRASGVASTDEERYAVPLPLPPLKRWFTDETDDLIDAYNYMVERLNEQYFHLEDQVRSRTREAQKARELREEANAAKSEFIAIISHELRTPLNGIMGLTAVSVDESDPAVVHTALRTIIESGHVLLQLLNELLELSKSLVGVEPVVTEFTPAKLMELIANLFTSRSDDLTVTFALAAVPQQLGHALLRGDLDHIAQICLSFMSNAMKFSAVNGNVSVIVHLKPLDDPRISLAPYASRLDAANSVLEIMVTDGGVGISPPQLARIFDLFVQGEDPLRKNQKGAGLGMALSKQLSEGIGGYVQVFSAKDVGTTVVLRAPVELVAQDEYVARSFYGPPIEFKVRDVYSTTSLSAGHVTQVPPATAAASASAASGTSAGMGRTPSKHLASIKQPFSRRSRHSHQLSAGSRMLLTKAQPVAEMLLPQSLYHSHTASHSHSMTQSVQRTESSRRSSFSYGSSQQRRRDSMYETPPEKPPKMYQFGRSGDSTTSLLLNVPSDLFDNVGRNSLVLDRLDAPDRQGSAEPPAKGKLKAATTSPVMAPSVVTPVSASSEANVAPAAPTVVGPPTQAMPPAPAAPPAHAAAPPAHGRRHANLQVSTDLGDVSSTLVITPTSHDQSPAFDFPEDLRILLAEDNPLNQAIMVKMLQSFGIAHVDVAGNGDRVIRMVEESIVGGWHYAVIFMDLSMPGTNGLDATNHLRGTLGYPYPIVALTGFSDTNTRNACRAVNIEELLTKPVMRHDVARVLRKYYD